MNRVELLGYIFIGILTFVLINGSVLTYRTANLIDPFSPEPPEIDFPDFEPSGRGSGGTVNLGFLRVLLYLLLFIGVLLGIYFLVKGGIYFKMQWSKQRESSVTPISKKRRVLEDARKKAYEIIERGLETGKYTVAFVEAYLALDTGLDNYRSLKRPKHMTPKEYSFSVDPPVFRPSVFKIVSVFYDLRFGSLTATRDNLFGFRTQLDYLFQDEIPQKIRTQWEDSFDLTMKKDYTFAIPRKGDYSKPGGKM